jgi:prepilin-type N-terminal cleavage/methylation domain-containing protein
MSRLPPSHRAFTLLELLTTVAIIAILAALLLPALQSGYSKAKRVACANNLKNVGTAFHAWGHDHNDLFPMQVSTNQGGTREFAGAPALNPDVSFAFRHFQAISNELVLPKLLACPADKHRIAAKDFPSLRNENVSYWINPAAAFGRTDSPIAGDRNVRTSGRIEWTFIQFGPADVVEFSAELHGYRGNVLFGDAHVDVLDSRALRLAFASSNAADVTLVIPESEVANTSDSNSGTGNGGGSPDGQAPAYGSIEGPSSTSDATAAKTDSDRAKATDVSRPAAGNRARPSGTADGPDERIIVVTRLDGTMVTSSVPQQVMNAIPGKAEIVPMKGETTTNPIIEFVQWLAHVSARGTYWLLFLLLLALIAFEIARRRAQRKRKSID